MLPDATSVLDLPRPLTVMDRLWARSGVPFVDALRALALATLGTGLLTLSAKAQVPFWPVPMTLQTLVVLLIGATYGARLGVATVALYLVEGAAGLPVFAGTPEKGLGLAYMMGPTGGYLVGFIVAAGLIGWLMEKGADRSFARLFVAMGAGHLVILGLGYAWLATLTNPAAAWTAGLLPFLWPTLVKNALATALFPAAQGLLTRFGR